MKSEKADLPKHPLKKIFIVCLALMLLNLKPLEVKFLCFFMLWFKFSLVLLFLTHSIFYHLWKKKEKIFNLKNLFLETPLLLTLIKILMKLNPIVEEAALNLKIAKLSWCNKILILWHSKKMIFLIMAAKILMASLSLFKTTINKASLIWWKKTFLIECVKKN
jgi:hypothetical protein